MGKAASQIALAAALVGGGMALRGVPFVGTFLFSLPALLALGCTKEPLPMPACR
jgi:hypothetical protein